MNRIALLLVLAFSLPVVARADDASHRAKAQQFMDLLGTQKNVQGVVEKFMKEISDAADKEAGANPTPEIKTKVADFEAKARQMIEASVGWKALQPEFTDIYAKSFTDEQLDAIIAFYKSPAGTALLTKMPDVNTQVGQLGGSHVQALQPQLQQLFAGFRKDIATTPAPGPPAGGPVNPPSAPPAPPK